MRVGHLIKSLGRGGAEALLPQMVRAAPETEFRAAYFLPWKNAVVDDLEASGCPVHCFERRRAPSILASAGAVSRWISDESLDLVHCHLPLAGVVGRWAARGAGVPCVYTEHNLLERYHPLTRWLNLRTWALQAEAVAVSGEVAESIARHASAEIPVTTVLNGIDTEAFSILPDRSGAKAALFGDVAGPVVGTVAVFRRQKRLDRWLDAAQRIADRHPDVRFLMVGAGPESGAVTREARRLGLEDRLVLPGLREDVKPYLAAMDIFLISSDFEGLPLALLEAMAAGLPVVSTPVGGIPEVLTEGAGRLAPDAEGLADAVVGLLDAPQEAADLARGGRERVARDFGIARMAAELDAIYRRVLRAGPGGTR